MKRLWLLLILIPMFVMPVSALDLAPPEAPESAEEFMPPDTESFSEGLWYILKLGISKLQPSIAQASGTCLSVVALVMLCSILREFTGDAKRSAHVACSVTLGILLFQPSNSLVQLGVESVQELVAYGKLILPVMTGAMAAQGGTTTSASLYTGTALFSAILSSLIGKLLIPMVYLYIFLGIAYSVLEQEHLKELKKFLKWLMTWTMKILLYIFTGYMGITGAITGSVDAAAVKAAKLTISGAVPVVGSIIADASETILVSAGIVKNGIGVYGLFAVIAILIGPFLRIGVQYLILKLTASVCGVFSVNGAKGLVSNFTEAMGMVLAMLGTVSLLLIVSLVCFMKGFG